MTRFRKDAEFTKTAHLGLGAVCLALLFLASCDRSEKNVPSSTGKDDVPARSEDKTEAGDKFDAFDPYNYPLFCGTGKRVIDSESAEFRKIVEMIKSFEGGEEHEVQFAIELDQGGIEVATQEGGPGSGYGWDILLGVDKDGGYSVLKKEYWRR